VRCEENEERWPRRIGILSLKEILEKSKRSGLLVAGVKE
jgi:hypothetical protein